MLTLSHDQIVQVKRTLQEDEQRFDHLLGLLEKWIYCHTFLPKNYDKRMLSIFLRSCKYNLDKTKQKFELYFVHKKRYPEVFRFYDFTDTEKRALQNFYAFQSSKLTPAGYEVSYTGFRTPETSGCDMNVVNKLMAMIVTYKASRDVINGGIILVINLQNLSPSIVTGIMNTFFFRLLYMVEKVYPFRVAGVYLTYLPGFAVPIANMVKMILNEKIKSRVHFDAGNEEMKKKIPTYCLPKEFGGTDGTINENAAKLIKEIERVKSWFLEEEQIQIMGDIPKDLYEISGIDEYFGTQGSFRKLNID